MDIRFFPLDFDYKIKEGKVLVYLYGQLEGGGKICVIDQHQPYFYARAENIDPEKLQKSLGGLTLMTKGEPAKVVGWEETEKELLGQRQKFWKILANYPKAVPPLSWELQSQGIDCYEKDVLFIHRYLRDKGITPLTLVQASGEFINDTNLRIPAFKAEKVSQLSKEEVKRLKVLALDIETYVGEEEIDPQKNPILMIGFYGMDGEGKEFKKVITWRRFPHQLDYLEVVSDEVDLLERFRQIIRDYQPDILTGYFSDRFDLPYIKARADKYNLKLDIGLDRSMLETGKVSDFRGGGSRLKGILHLDMFHFIRNIFGRSFKVEDYSLNAVSQELLGHKKHEVHLEELGRIWDSHPEQLEDFCEYNLHDAHLALQLCLKLFPDMIEFTKLIGLPLDDLIRMRFSRLVESYIMKRAIEYDVIAPNRPAGGEMDRRREKTYKGGFVLEPNPGLYERIAVFDFLSLYPTIITAHHLGPEGLRCSCCQEGGKVPGLENYWFCQRGKKFISTVLEQLILVRADVKRQIREANEKREDTKILEARSYALKNLANSFYGYLGFFGARWYCLECAQSTTAYARDYIQKTIQRAGEKGFEVIYGDTDSMFLLLGDRILGQALEFMNEINFELPGHMELEFEGFYRQGIFVPHKSGEGGAKKKYALLSDKGWLKITGFESIRRNWSPLAKEVQEKVLRMVLEGRAEEALNYVQSIVIELQKGTLPLEKLVIKTQITKELEDYASIGPHVAVARRMLGRGMRIVPGTIIKYVIVKGPGLVRERAKLVEEAKDKKYDPDYYLYNQVIPAVSSIFTVLGYREDEIFQESSQTGLGKFF